MGIDCEVEKATMTHWLVPTHFLYLDITSGEFRCKVPLGQDMESLYSLCKYGAQVIHMGMLSQGDSRVYCCY